MHFPPPPLQFSQSSSHFSTDPFLDPLLAHLSGLPSSSLFLFLGPPVVPFSTPFLGKGSPTKIDNRKNIGYQLLLTSLLELLEDLVSLLARSGASTVINVQGVFGRPVGHANVRVTMYPARTKKDYRKKGALLLTSLLQNLAGHSHVLNSCHTPLVINHLGLQGTIIEGWKPYLDESTVSGQRKSSKLV